MLSLLFSLFGFRAEWDRRGEQVVEQPSPNLQGLTYSVSSILVDSENRWQNICLRNGPLGPERFSCKLRLLGSRIIRLRASLRALIKYIDFSLWDQWWYSATVSN
jgi:hypothetical protein